MATSPKSDPSTDQLTFWSEEHLASPSPKPADERAFAIHVATWPSSSSSLLLDFQRDGWSSRTCPAFCFPAMMENEAERTTRRLTQEEGSDPSRVPGLTLEPSSGRWGNSGLGSLTEFWTLSTAEWPSDGVASSLLDVLEETGERLRPYCLSAKACEGLIRRAERRGRTLPKPLQRALQIVIQTSRGREISSQEP